MLITSRASSQNNGPDSNRPVFKTSDLTSLNPGFCRDCSRQAYDSSENEQGKGAGRYYFTNMAADNASPHCIATVYSGEVIETASGPRGSLTVRHGIPWASH